MEVNYADLFWLIAPMPGSAYPSTAFFWYIAILWVLLWSVWTSKALKTSEIRIALTLFQNSSDWPMKMVLPFIVGVGVIAVVKVLSIPLKPIGYTM